MFHLIFHLDKDGYKGIILESFSSLKEIDKYIQNNFRNRQDVIKQYSQDISEFCLDKRESIENENARNKRNRLGTVTLVYEINNVYKKIPIIYKNDNKLLSKEICIKKIKEMLNDDNILGKLYNTKKHLLSKNEIDLLDSYKDLHDIQKKNDAITFFINRIKNMDEDGQYFYFRSLMNLCRLNKFDLNISKGCIKDISISSNPLILTKETVGRKIESQSEDDYFNRLIDEENYDELFNIYDRDIIERDTNLFK